MQYTSGSTGTPKGVMVTHSNILHNSAVIYQCFQHSPSTNGVMWLPMFHDMGLVGGVMQPIYSDRPTVLMSPVALIQKPWRWLEAISRYGATTSGGPNFAYDLLWRQATPEKLANLDLSSWEVAFSGAEPVRAETLERFAETFAPCGFRREAFYPCYGLAEATLFVSGGWKDSAPQVKYVDAAAMAENRVVEVSPEAGGKAIVSCGRARSGDEIAIADPETVTPLPENRVGEILIAGAGVAKGYWRQPEETKRTFEVYLGEGEKRGPFLRSGDLGFLSGGELYITGRIKELMIFWGRNRYPQQIEETVEKCHPALRFGCGAAFSIEVENEEKLVVAFEVERSYLRKLNVEEIVGAIRLAVAEEQMVDVWAIALLKTGSIPKTTSGKIRRGECRRQFLEGGLSVVGEWRTPEAGNFLRQWSIISFNQ
jgi:acyl-CoA synthetase (AMP-forming)/AMP-acid ligase II